MVGIEGASGVMAQAALSGFSDGEFGRVLADLSGPRNILAEALPDLPRVPGLYAVHGSPEVWDALGLGAPPDTRPLYVGKSESSLHSWDLLTHFGDGRTGSSTVRRSFAALLRDSLGLRGVPRNRDKPERCANYGLIEEHDVALTKWMRAHLQLSVWRREGIVSLEDLETDVLRVLLPPVNLSKVRTPWKQQVASAREAMAEEARGWARERGFTC